MQINPSKLANRAHRVNGPIRRGARSSLNTQAHSSFANNPAPAPQTPGMNPVVPLPTRGIQEMGDNQPMQQFARGGIAGAGYMPPPVSPYGHTQVVDRPQVRQLGIDQPEAVVPLKRKNSSRVLPSQVPGLIQKYSGR